MTKPVNITNCLIKGSFWKMLHLNRSVETLDILARLGGGFDGYFKKKNKEILSCFY